MVHFFLVDDILIKVYIDDSPSCLTPYFSRNYFCVNLVRISFRIPYHCRFSMVSIKNSTYTYIVKCKNGLQGILKDSPW